ncbi:MAG: DUF1636 domain-containing protein [Rhodobacteraceae bacterium]|nr:DUF1636 domain-containing protein [Paracoccaceae bacterium]
MRHCLTVCSTCCKAGDAPLGAGLAQALRRLLSASKDADIRAFEVATVECMSVCGEPIGLSFRASGKAAYLFAGIDPTKDAADILAFARLYLEAPDGIIEDARPCGRLRFCLRARIPAVGTVILPE